MQGDLTVDNNEAICWIPAHLFSLSHNGAKGNKVMHMISTYSVRKGMQIFSEFGDSKP